MADVKEVVYNVLDRMFHEIFELGRLYEKDDRIDMSMVTRKIDECIEWAKEEKVINVRVETKIVGDGDNE